MIYPTIAELTKGKFNRYELVIGAAKCARLVTEEYVAQREKAEKMIANRETDKPLASLVNPEYRDQKAVKIGIGRLKDGTLTLVRASEQAETIEEKTETEE